MHVIAAKAVAFKEALQPEFKEYQKQTLKNAQTLGERLMEHGLKLVSGGTDTHLVLVDLRDTEFTGNDAEIALEKAGITVNKNAIPFDPRPPAITSGIRIGTPAITTRGMGENEMNLIGDMIVQALNNSTDDTVLEGINGRVKELCDEFPIYRYKLS